MFADKFNSNNRTYPSRERRPRRSVVLKYVLTDSRKGCPYDFLLNLLFVVDDAHIVPMKIFIIRLCRIGTLRTAFPTKKPPAGIDPAGGFANQII